MNFAIVFLRKTFQFLVSKCVIMKKLVIPVFRFAVRRVTKTLPSHRKYAAPKNNLKLMQVSETKLHKLDENLKKLDSGNKSEYTKQKMLRYRLSVHTVFFISYLNPKKFL